MRRSRVAGVVVIAAASLFAAGLVATPTAQAAVGISPPDISHAAAPKVPSISSEPAPAVAADGEIPSARSAFSRTFTGAGVAGSSGKHLTGVGYRTRVYATPVNYQDSQGVWQKIDATLHSVSGGWSDATSAAADAVIPATLDKGVAVGAAGVRFTLTGAAAVGPTVSGSSATYSAALPGVTVTTTTVPGGFRQVFALDGPSRQSTFTTRVNLPVGARLVATADGGAEILQGGTVLGSIPAPTVSDASGIASKTAATLSVSGADLVETIDPSWLHDPHRSFPVSLDPDYYAYGSSATIQSANPNTNISGTGTTICAGWSNTSSSSPERGLVSFPDVGTIIPQDAELVATVLGAHVTSVAATGTIAVHSLTRAFTASQVTWNKADSLTSWTTAGGDFTSEGDRPQSISSPDASNSYHHWGLNPAFIQSWLDGGVQGGFVFTSTNEASSSQVCMTGSTDPYEAPFLDLTWQDRTGLRPDQQYFDRNISDHESIHINLGNGNLTVVSKDMSDNAPGVPFAVYRTWNSSQADQVWQNGYGWYQAPAESGDYSFGPDPSVYIQDDGTAIKDSALVGGQPWRPWHLQHYDYTGSMPYGTDNAPPGLHEYSGFDSSGNRTITDNESGTVQTLTSATNYQIETVKDRNGNVESINHSGNFAPLGDSYPSTVVDTAGRTWTWNHSGSSTNGYYTSVTGPTVATGTLTTSYTYSGGNVYTGNSGDGNLLTATDASGGVTTYHYDSSRRIDMITSPTGNEITFGYAGSGYGTSGVNSMTLVTNTSTGAGYTYYFTRTGYNHTGGTNTDTVQDPNGHNTVYTLDPHDHVTQVTDALGHSRSASYGTDVNGNSVTSAVNANGTGVQYTSTYGYDTQNRYTGTTQPPSGASTPPDAANDSVAYVGSPTGRVDTWLPHTYTPADTSTTTSGGSTTTFNYDIPGNLTSTSLGGATTHTYTYNPIAPNTPTCGGKPGERCTDVDGNTNTTSYHYDTSGNLDTLTPPSPLGAHSYSYDAAGRMTSTTDGKSQTINEKYDGMGRLTQVNFNSTTTCTSTDISNKNCIQLTYYADGYPHTLVDDTGTTTYTYDSLGRESTRSVPGQTTMTLTYDGASNVLSYADGSGTINYGYNNANQLTGLAEPGGSCTGTVSLCTTFGYNNKGYRTSTTYPTTSATVMTSTPDNAGRIKEMKVTVGGVTKSDFTYGYAYTPAGLGHTKDGTLVRTRVDVVNSLTTTYGYDDLGRLTSAVEKNSGGITTASWTYTYDAAGNLCPSTSHTGCSNYYAYNSANEITGKNGSSTGWSFDGNGNETAGAGSATRTSETWNAHDQLTATTVGGTTENKTYTGLGQDGLNSVGSTTLRNSQVGIAAQTTSGTTTQFVRDPQGTLISSRTGGSSSYYSFDGLGSTINLYSSSGSTANSYSYDPYGQSRGSSGSVVNPFQYAGGYLDSAAGLYKYGARYYDPVEGRFNSQDPSGREVNLFAYASDSPSSRVDPTGLDDAETVDGATKLVEACGTGAVLGAVFSDNPLVALGGCAEGYSLEEVRQILDYVGLHGLANALDLYGKVGDLTEVFDELQL